MDSARSVEQMLCLQKIDTFSMKFMAGTFSNKPVGPLDAEVSLQQVYPWLLKTADIPVVAVM